MTLPLDTLLPLHSEKIKEGGESLNTYLRDLTTTLQRQYDDIAHTINGDTRRSVDTGSRQYTPTVSGLTTAGVGTYVHQTGWVFRQGLMIDFFFDLRWTAHTGTGSLIVDMPYQCAEIDHFPFVGPIMAQNVVFTGYLSGVALPGTRSLEIVDTRSGLAFNNITVPNTDTTLRGTIRYVGVGIERS